MSAPEAFEKWWQALPLRNGEITADHIRQAWDAGVVFERTSCAQVAAGLADGADCDDRGMQDPETGEVPCAAEARGEVCVCVERSDLAHKIATKIRARD